MRTSANDFDYRDNFHLSYGFKEKNYGPIIMPTELDAATLVFLRKSVESSVPLTLTANDPQAAAEHMGEALDDTVRETIEGWPYAPDEDPPPPEVRDEAYAFLRNAIVDGRLALEAFTDPQTCVDAGVCDPPPPEVLEYIRTRNVEDLLRQKPGTESIVGVASAAVIVGVTIVLFGETTSATIEDFGGVERL